MQFKLGTNIKVGQKIKTADGWRKIKEVNSCSARVKEGLVTFGSIIYGWKAS
jgi:hypothetical protein